MTDTDTNANTVEEVTAEIRKLAMTTVPRGAEVRQLYQQGDLTKVGQRTGDSIKRMADTMASEINACIEAHEGITKMMREDADVSIAEIKRHADELRERMVAYGEAAHDVQTYLRTLTSKVIQPAQMPAPFYGIDKDAATA